MKLYTEEQVIELTKAAFTAGQNHNSFIFWEELKNITPIELPSDEEIKNEIGYDWFDPDDIAFFGGIGYLRSKIQGGNK